MLASFLLMNKNLRPFFCLLLLVLLLGGTTGCYERTVTAPYQSDDKEVIRIREQLGVTTADKEYTNVEEEDEDE